MRCVLAIFAVALAAASSPARARAADVLEARVRIAVADEGPHWVGQRVLLEVELMANAALFTGQLFRAPEVLGGLFQKDESSPLFGSERVGAETWQVQRYAFSLFPQRAGTLVVPPIQVSFRVSAGYGQAEHAFALQTNPVRVEARLPAGVVDAAGLVTTSHLELDVSWDGELEEPIVGDALTRVIRRRGDDVSAMLFAPFPVPEIPGLAAYPKPPELTDRALRGRLTGERVDTVTFVAQRPGRYRIPELVVRAWDPENEILEQRSLGGLELDVRPNPALGPSTMLGYTLDRTAREYPVASAVAVLTVSLAIAAGGYFRRRIGSAWRSWRRDRAEREQAEFARLTRTCRRGTPAQTYAALAKWISRARVVNGPVTAKALADAWRDDALARQLDELQRAMVDPEASWSGRALAASLRRLRKEKRRQAARAFALPPLNPC